MAHHSREAFIIMGEESHELLVSDRQLLTQTVAIYALIVFA